MQVKNKKLIKPILQKMLDKALPYYVKTIIKYDKEKAFIFHNETVDQIIKRIFEIIESVKGTRSLPELHMYWVFCEWIAPHLPVYKDIEFWNKDTVHIFFKTVKKISSISFENMSEIDFNTFFNDIQKWCATYIFEITVFKMMEEFEGHNKKKEYDAEGNLLEGK